MNGPVSDRVIAATASLAPVQDFYFNSRYAERRGQPGVADFTFGNPQEFPLTGLVQALHRRADPQSKDWYAYKTNEAAACAFLADSLARELGVPFEADDIAMTPGAFGAIALAFRLLLSPGDEVLIPLPGWFCYGSMLAAEGVKAVQVPLDAKNFDLDLAAIDAAITPRTRIVVVNTPHNPTGRIYPREQLEALAELLERASRRIGRRIYLLSDEPYRRLRFDGRPFVSPAAVYPWTLIDYSYGKVLLAPGQRLGYLALSPLMPAADRRAIRENFFGAQCSLGWAFASALMQHAVPDLEALTIDIAALTRRRDRMVGALTQWGYEVIKPEGTFYLFGRAPDGNSDGLFDALADRDVFIMPGRVLSTPEHFRVCLTATDAMVEQALPAFQDAARRLAA
ncbi:MAG TPA: aminotransferase class I/II-fold pyridoxal phosphate-dependent enzyme [Kiloniellaceae bacterium]|nr:aminotransferase class I/II-fold pyridoxal phosphate-dependent enzyme [Kiloniellaceae bacterium]